MPVSFFFCTAVLSRGTKGIPQSSIGFRMNVGKLESRMICRRLEKDGMIKVRPRLLIHCYIIFRPFLPPNLHLLNLFDFYLSKTA